MKKIRLYSLILSVSVFCIGGFNIVKANAESVDKSVDLVISFKESIDDDVVNLIRDNGGIIDYFPELNGIEVNCSEELIPKIFSKPTVESVSPNHIITMADINKNEEDIDFSDPSIDLRKYQWDVDRVTNNGESYNISNKKTNVIVGIIDSGVDTKHSDLKNNFRGGTNLVPNNFKNDSSETGDPADVDDRNGHGTNVAGMISANGRMKGVAPNIGFKSYRVFNQYGQTTPTICAKAIKKATDDGVKVINLSIGSYNLKGKCFWTSPKTGKVYKLKDDMADYSLMKRAIRYAVDNGVVVVVAAGNESLDCSDKKGLTEYLNDCYSQQGFRYEGLTYEVPASLKGVITVSSLNKKDKLADYSNFGKNLIDLTAPGGDFRNPCLTTDVNNSYIFTYGTSFSTPKVSATAALILNQCSTLTPKSVGKLICKYTDRIDDNLSRDYYGDGCLNTYKILEKVEKDKGKIK